ncbi:high-affinity cgmp-specific 3 [Schistosoma japonicum]|nr:high-affinity cgmp-specific 3 [Schistosoma japonicum]
MTAFDLISNPSANIINGLTPSESRHFRKSVISDDNIEEEKEAAAEKQADLPVALHMDPDLVIKSSSQLNFLHTILIPLIKELTYIFRELNTILLFNVPSKH